MSYEADGIGTGEEIERALQQALAAILGRPPPDDPDGDDVGGLSIT